MNAKALLLFAVFAVNSMAFRHDPGQLSNLQGRYAALLGRNESAAPIALRAAPRAPSSGGTSTSSKERLGLAKEALEPAERASTDAEEDARRAYGPADCRASRDNDRRRLRGPPAVMWGACVDQSTAQK